jgi:glucose-6-phosphate 1-dehydrogenase
MTDDLHRAIEAAKSLRLDLARLTTGDDQLLADMFEGETTLDVEIRAAVLQIEEDEQTGQPQAYASGSWGPDAADELLARDGRRWRRP